MKPVEHMHFANRYEVVTEDKARGATYTPKALADFVARCVVGAAGSLLQKDTIRILDPAVGDGELLISILQELGDQRAVEVHGFETSEDALTKAKERISDLFPLASLQLQHESFLDFVVKEFGIASSGPLFADQIPPRFDLIIANPPYVRTQILRANHAQFIARQFGLSGRLDLYHAFLAALALVLDPKGVAGVIVSNRFMTTRSGAPVRTLIRKNYNIRHIWDLGDTKLFRAAVLPAVLLLTGKESFTNESPDFTSIYTTTALTEQHALSTIDALAMKGVVALPDHRHFRVMHGRLDINGGLDEVWRITTNSGDDWLSTVNANTWGTFGDIGKIRVGVKTCADSVFIRSDWGSFPINERPELLRPLITHHIAHRFRVPATTRQRQILYPHEVVDGKRQAVDLSKYPRSQAYLEKHRALLEARKYVLDAGRHWFEIWVPQDPATWSMPKLVFRDISEQPTFWIDECGGIVNGDCYWLTAERPGTDDLLWIALAVANSTFIEAFYDCRFHNKLYAGRRRFMTQYVEQFPLLNPQSLIGRQVIELSKMIYATIGTPDVDRLEPELNTLIWRAFGLSLEEVTR